MRRWFRGRLWGHHDFLRLWLSQWIDMFGGQVVDLALPTLAILQLHAGPAQVGVLVGLEFVGFDPWQAEHLAATIEAEMKRRRRNQRLFHTEPFARSIPPQATNLREQCSLMIQFFQDGHGFRAACHHR